MTHYENFACSADSSVEPNFYNWFSIIWATMIDSFACQYSNVNHMIFEANLQQMCSVNHSVYVNSTAKCSYLKRIPTRPFYLWHCIFYSPMRRSSCASSEKTLRKTSFFANLLLFIILIFCFLPILLCHRQTPPYFPFPVQWHRAYKHRKLRRWFKLYKCFFAQR